MCHASDPVKLVNCCVLRLDSSTTKGVRMLSDTTGGTPSLLENQIMTPKKKSFLSQAAALMELKLFVQTITVCVCFQVSSRWSAPPLRLVRLHRTTVFLLLLFSSSSSSCKPLESHLNSAVSYLQAEIFQLKFLYFSISIYCISIYFSRVESE